jgi:hypothetical protein
LAPTDGADVLAALPDGAVVFGEAVLFAEALPVLVVVDPEAPL